jgi:hypothetical protein
MLDYKPNTSILVPYQVPEFIRDNPDYSTFILFLKSYYEWLEQTGTANTPGNIGAISNSLLDYKDIDKTPDQFLDSFYNDFLNYFPKEILADKTKVTKLAKELYRSKGTPSSYKFLFRVLYNSDVDFFFTKDVILKPSSGKWYVTKSLRLLTSDTNFLNISNLRLFGVTSKAIATVENSVAAGNKIEVFISNILRLFSSGEFVKVVDSNNQDVYFKDGEVVSSTTSGAELLTAKIVGQISQIKINPNYRGQTYVGYDSDTGYPGDPIVIYGGLSSNTGIGAEAKVGTTTAGSVVSIATLFGGYGYRENPNTKIVFSNLVGRSPKTPIAEVGSVNTSPVTMANVRTSIEYIGLAGLTYINAAAYSWASANTLAHANSRIANTLSYTSFTTYPISSVIVQNGGGGLTQKPTATAQSVYQRAYSGSYSGTNADLKNLGILAPIQIVSGGSGYVVNDKINILGGTGAGAYANVITVSGSGAITSVSYVNPPSSNTANTFYPYPLGGLGYSSLALPFTSITSTNPAATNAILSIPGILGDGAVLEPATDRIGQIQTISISNYGEDYIAAPTVSFKVQDIVVKNISLGNLPGKGDAVYQGANSNVASYTASVDYIEQISTDANPLESLFFIRIYNYNKPQPNTSLPLKIDSKSISMNVVTGTLSSSLGYPRYPTIAEGRYDTANNIYTYGDGTAKGTATFLNGLTIGDGQYLDSSGQLSSSDVLQSVNYNNYTYEITLEKEIAKYRKLLLELLHPAGTRLKGRFAMKSNSSIDFHLYDALYQGYPLSRLLSDTVVTFNMESDFTNYSNNIITFKNISPGTNIANIFTSNTIVKFTTANGDLGGGLINSINYLANTITLTTNTWLTFGNVATVRANPSTSTINITAITDSYNIINNGVYSNTAAPLRDIIKAGDTIETGNMIRTVQSVNYSTNVITLTANLTYGSNGYLSVRRTYTGIPSNFIVYGPVGQEYFTEVVTEDGLYTITDEDGKTILLD